LSALSLSRGFQQLYCDATVFDAFNMRYPISFKHVLPFQPQDRVVDNFTLIDAELAHLAHRDDNTRRAVIDAYTAYGLMTSEDAANLKPVVDLFGADFFDLMGLVYANAGMSICALRWYRECIVALESGNGEQGSDMGDVYASVGYCLYSLGMFEEAIAWTKSCLGPLAMADVVSRTIIDYEAQQMGGSLRAVERATNRRRYTISAPVPGNLEQITARLRAALKAIIPYEEIYIDWVPPEKPLSEPGEGYPFRWERDSDLGYLRHKMNLLFAIAGQADALAATGSPGEARALLYEAAMLEPNADFIQERIKALA
jgi:tetratricopeptide (TPR) repeat protein